MRAPAPLRDLVRFLLPARCLGCASPLPMDAPTAVQRTLVCAPCMAALREPPWPRCPRCHAPRGTGRVSAADCLECSTWPPSLVGARASAMLEPPCDALVHALKYGGWRDLARPLGDRLARTCPPDSPDALVVPVPTTPERLRKRGYNQAGLLADAYAARVGTTSTPALERVRGGPSQVSLAPERRRINVDGCFAASASVAPVLRGRPVVLVDDVLTTGATAAAAATALERAGAGGVTVVALARALPGRGTPV